MFTPQWHLLKTSCSTSINLHLWNTIYWNFIQRFESAGVCLVCVAMYYPGLSYVMLLCVNWLPVTQPEETLHSYQHNMWRPCMNGRASVWKRIIREIELLGMLFEISLTFHFNKEILNIVSNLIGIQVSSNDTNFYPTIRLWMLHCSWSLQQKQNWETLQELLTGCWLTLCVCRNWTCFSQFNSGHSPH